MKIRDVKMPCCYWHRTAVNTEVTLVQECAGEALRDAQRIKTHLLQRNEPGRKQYLYTLKRSWASLVAQWLGVHLPMQGTRVRAPVREDPTCRGAAGPVCHNY